MFEIDKKEFGNFIARLRKEKNITQKELAEKLFVSDKAVSKWECGLSMPDITLLKPLAEILDVTVAELLECRRIEKTEHIDIDKVDAIIHKAVLFSEEELQEQKARKEKNGRAFIICALVCCVELIISLLIYEGSWEQLLLPNLLPILLSFIFGIWFCFLAKEQLPAYYDENNISTYSDGFFQMHMPGIRFNNRNWRHILRVGRLWCLITMVLSPIVGLILNLMFDALVAMILSYSLILTLVLCGFFIPIYVVAKKYE